MIKNKHLSCVSFIAMFLAIVLVFSLMVNPLETVSASETPEYLEKIFDDSIVHTIDIQINKNTWNELLKNSIKEEYYICDIELDGVLFKNVAIRAKGNTSLSQIANSDSDRYSFKIKFNEYDKNKTCYGLDKLALNNLMADTSYMKDYITYEMMNYIGANAPYSAFMNVTVNGEPWGLYLGVECIDESFLERNYGKNYGELYKPETVNAGVGEKENNQAGGMSNLNNANELIKPDNNSGRPSMDFNGEIPNFNPGDMNEVSGQRGPGKGNTPRNEGDGNFQDANNMMPPDMNVSTGYIPNKEEMPNELNPGNIYSNDDFNMFKGANKGGIGFGNNGGSDLVYIDDNVNSYSSIFNNAKTIVNNTDKARLINSLKILSTGNDLDTVIDIENTMKYWVIHNFVINGDSYTGTMTHNYYLYEENGVMTMLPWDYNLAFGGFSMGPKWQSNATDVDSTTAAVNTGIDTPLLSSTEEARPFWGKLIQNNDYKELYHKYYAEFINDFFLSGYFEEKINKMYELLLPYVENDISAFYTVEEFKIGVETLKEFCILRAESIKKQLSGEIAIDNSNSENYIDASHINLKNLGSMGSMSGFNKEDNFPNEVSEEKLIFSLTDIDFG